MNQNKQALIILVVLLIFLIAIIATIVVISNRDPQSYEYNGYKVRYDRQGNYIGYQTEVFINGQGPYYMSTRFDPKSLEEIPIDNVQENIINKEEVFIHIKGLNESFRGKTTVAALEFNNLIERFFSVEIKYEENNNLCSDVNSTTGIVEFRLSDKNKISNENGCTIIEGITEDDFIKGADSIAYHLLGIMEYES